VIVAEISRRSRPKSHRARARIAGALYIVPAVVPAILPFVLDKVDRETAMNKRAVAATMTVIGVGLVVFAVSDYVSGGAGYLGGWSEGCRYVMTVGAMLATSGRLMA
jgi:hypothetical protein